jgi:hypothetical protein
LHSGAFESVQRVALPAPVVAWTTSGARTLGERYWSEVQRSTLGLVRARKASTEPELRLLGRGPVLLRFGAPELVATAELVACLYPICGGLLVRAPGGSISFSQAGSRPVELRSAIDGFFPRLAGMVYRQQARLHAALSRRYFARLWREAGR